MCKKGSGLNTFRMPCIYRNYLVPLRYWCPVYIAKLLLLIVYLFLVLLFFYFSIFSLDCWEGPVSKYFTVSLHLLFTKHVTNHIWFDLSLTEDLQQEVLLACGTWADLTWCHTKSTLIMHLEPQVMLSATAKLRPEAAIMIPRDAAHSGDPGTCQSVGCYIYHMPADCQDLCKTG